MNEIPRSTRFTQEFICPRADEAVVFNYSAKSFWVNDDTCNYCGSLNPDLLMERIEAGTVKITPTDKNYKIYVTAEPDTELFKQTYGDKYEFVTRAMKQTKFYFQHLSKDQRKRFIKLLNEKKLKLDYPGYFYRLPYFARVEEENVL